MKGILDEDFLLTLAKSFCDSAFIKEAIAHEDKKQQAVMERLFEDTDDAI